MFLYLFIVFCSFAAGYSISYIFSRRTRLNFEEEIVSLRLRLRELKKAKSENADLKTEILRLKKELKEEKCKTT